MFAVGEVVRPVWAGAVCVLDAGHDGQHRDRAGDGWWALSASLTTRALAADPEPEFRSPRCVVGRHDRCRDGVPRETDVPGVRHLPCDCPCHPAPPT
ncbi:hypothetical protein ACWGIN_21565 [Streptomyces sp. NPDC054861]